ncbi:MAG: hypothetical protein H8K05_05270 [Nitrospira sp.]|nr:hypothetical protein [Nitrospira sp.]MCS6317180.1 hypothetical protein [Nitrospira sp.]
MALLRPAKRGLWLSVCLVASLVQAAPDPAPSPDEIEADFLDFLGSWQNDSGRWVDPFQVAEDLSVDHRPKSKTDVPGQRTSPSPRSKGSEQHRSSTVPRDPMRMQTGP